MKIDFKKHITSAKYDPRLGQPLYSEGYQTGRLWSEDLSEETIAFGGLVQPLCLLAIARNDYTLGSRRHYEPLASWTDVGSFDVYKIGSKNAFIDVWGIQGEGYAIFDMTMVSRWTSRGTVYEGRVMKVIEDCLTDEDRLLMKIMV